LHCGGGEREDKQQVKQQVKQLYEVKQQIKQLYEVKQQLYQVKQQVKQETGVWLYLLRLLRGRTTGR
jgi:hypothetical protein